MSIPVGLSSAGLPIGMQLIGPVFSEETLFRTARMFERAAGSRGSHCILDEDGIEMHPGLIDPDTGEPYRFRRENEALRNQVLCARHDAAGEDLFELWDVAPRPIPDRDVAFEPAWAEFREGTIYGA